MKSIRYILPAQKVNMGGILLDQAIPVQGVDMIDPFLLVHHWSDKIPGNRKQQEVGVGPHPHRGFTPVTFVFKGSVHHRDSRGNDSIVNAGGTQWMDSGMGIVHSERPAKELAEKGGDFEIIQFWVNVPAKFKMNQPKYIPLQNDKTGVVTSKDGLVKAAVVAGEFGGVKGSIQTITPMLLLRLDVKKGGKISIPYPASYNSFLYQLDGKMKINNDKESKPKDLVWFKNEPGEIEIEGLENSRAILLAGEPINEPVATYGPFVMNTQTEIMQAMKDYQTGKMGVLIEEFN